MFSYFEALLRPLTDGDEQVLDSFVIYFQHGHIHLVLFVLVFIFVYAVEYFLTGNGDDALDYDIRTLLAP